MHLSVITPDKTLYYGECRLVQIPGSDGLFEVLDNHAPIIALLGKGRIKAQEPDGKELFFNVEGGMVKVNNNRMVILCG